MNMNPEKTSVPSEIDISTHPIGCSCEKCYTFTLEYKPQVIVDELRTPEYWGKKYGVVE